MKLKNCMILGLSVMTLLTGCQNTEKSEKITEQSLETVSESETDSRYIKNITKKVEEETTTISETETESESKNENLDNLDYKAYAEYQMKKETNDIIATIKVKDKGDIKIKLFSEAAPKAVENFITHAKEGYYNGLTFHRVINDFMIQSGDPKGNSTGGESIWGQPFENECTLELVPYKGALCMANQGTDNSNTSQFFIVTANPNEEIIKELITNNYPNSLIESYKTYGGAPWLYQSYTVFGQVIEGLEIAEDIQKVRTDNNDKPVENVIVEKIEITE